MTDENRDDLENQDGSNSSSDDQRSETSKGRVYTEEEFQEHLRRAQAAKDREIEAYRQRVQMLETDTSNRLNNLVEQYLNTLPEEKRAAARAHLDEQRRLAELRQMEATATERYKRAIAKELAVDAREYGVTEADLLQFDSQEEMQLYIREKRLEHLENQGKKSGASERQVERPGGSKGSGKNSEAPKTVEEWLMRGWEEEGWI